MRRASILAVVGLLVAACEVFPVPGTRFGREGAIERATAGSDGSVRVLDVRFEDGAPPTWTVVLAVDELRPCGPAPAGGEGPAVCHVTSRTVVFDARDWREIERTEDGTTR